MRCGGSGAGFSLPYRYEAMRYGYYEVLYNMK